MWARLSVRVRRGVDSMYLKSYAVLIKFDDNDGFVIHWAPMNAEPQEISYKSHEIAGDDKYTVYPGPRLYCLFGVMRETADGILEKLRS